MTEDEQKEMLQLLRDNNKILKELLEIAHKITSPDYIKTENENDFYMNVVANLVAKKIEHLV